MLFDKYVPAGLDLILEGLVDGRQEAKIKTIVPLTNLNMVRTSIQTSNVFALLLTSSAYLPDFLTPSTRASFQLRFSPIGGR